MRRTGSPPALLAGLLALIVIGTVVLVRTVSSDPDATGRPAGAAPPSPPTPPALAPPSTARPFTGTATYAGRARGSRAVVALAVRNGSAVAYICDGRRLELWLYGRIHPEGLVRLQGPKGIVTGSIQGDTLIVAAGLDEENLLAFRAPAVKAPSGLYRAVSTVRGARLVGGWIVLPGGDQVGIVDLGRDRRPAPALDPAAGAVTVDGVRVPVAPADPARP
ncbi:hypothetical protein GCM10010191_34310 [Actinomadura vinacea]|uniref:Serine/threonine protein kinase n=1 Tax=Actinomadura vinacea TaxID=115336 RepID=A0ABN3J2U1_9ACTN